MTRILDAALADVREAARYFQTVSPELRRRFLSEFEVTLARVATAPEVQPKWLAVGVPEGIRHANFPRFPYHLIFLLEERQSPLVLAMRGHRQDHLDWLERVAAEKPTP